MSAHRGDTPPRNPSGLRFSAWNLLLLVPLLVLITPLFNVPKPALFGLPFFYWFQLAFVVVGVACVAITYAATRDSRGRHRTPATPSSVDELDEGAQQ